MEDAVYIEPLLAQHAPGSLYRDIVYNEPLLAQYALVLYTETQCTWFSIYRDTVHNEPVLE